MNDIELIIHSMSRVGKPLSSATSTAETPSPEPYAPDSKTAASSTPTAKPPNSDDTSPTTSPPTNKETMHYPHDPLTRFAQGKPQPKHILNELANDGYITPNPHDNTYRLTPHGEATLNTP